MAETRRENLIDVQTLGDFLSIKLVDAIKLSPLVEVDRTLVGRPGSKLTLPKYMYIGDAQNLAEGVAGEATNLAQTSEEVEILKAFKAVSITDEAILSGYGDPVNQIGQQLLVAMASKIENDLFVEMAKADKEVTYTEFDKNVVADAQIEFGEDIFEPMYLFINAKDYANLRKDDAFVHIQNGERVVDGHVGQIFGAEIIVSNRVAEGEAFLMKAGALALIMKRDVMVEADRDIMRAVNTYTCNEHYACHLKYADKVVKIRKA